TCLPVLSLYGEHRKPSPGSLAGLDALVFDIQDIGCRFYTYISTMNLAMEAAAERGLSFFVLDRINPIGGDIVDGPSWIRTRSFTATHPISIQHGMTVGELALLFRAEQALDLDLTIVPVTHWARSHRWDETTLPWVNPSPNMRSLTAAMLYPGIGLLEFMELSVGRGTETPFEWIGAPYVEREELLAYLQSLPLPGVSLEPASFTPEASKFVDTLCHGVRFEITNRDTFRPLDLGIAIAHYLCRHHSEEVHPQKLETLLVHPTATALQSGAPLPSIRPDWKGSLQQFRDRRMRFLLYD
ncbi:MAG: DUF1343 domain-containing protein, partial [Verrucomicrobiota bacterium]